MNRGRAIQPERECDYCGTQLPALRHPEAKYCNTICRGRDRYQREHDGPGVKCLDCGRMFARVGSHVVQAHGYESTLEYRQEHGLMGHETRVEEHAETMRAKVSKKAIENLERGEPYRYRKGGKHGEKVTKFWQNRKKKSEYKKLNSNLRGNHV